MKEMENKCEKQEGWVQQQEEGRGNLNLGMRQVCAVGEVELNLSSIAVSYSDSIIPFFLWIWMQP